MVKTRFLTVEMEGYRQARWKARIIHVVLGYKWRHQYELMFSLIQIQKDIYVEIFINMCIYMDQYTRIHFLFFQLRRFRINATPNSSCRSHFLIPFSNKRNQSYLEKWLILRLEQGIHKMSMEHFIAKENKKVLQKHLTMGIRQGAREPPERALVGQSWNKLSNKV